MTRVSIKAIAMAIATAVAGAQCSLAASVVLDSFSQGSFHLQNGGDTTDRSSISTQLGLDTREVDGRGSGTWDVIFASGTGVLNYNVTEILSGSGTSRFSMTLSYQRALGGSWSLLGYDAVVFDFTNITGEGLLEVLVNVYDTNPGESLRVPLISAGQIVYPLESGLDRIGALNVRILPLTDTFSMSLNEISVIPEPSVSGMLLPLAALIAGRRTRRN